jgi:hypothetical protein
MLRTALIPLDVAAATISDSTTVCAALSDEITIIKTLEYGLPRGFSGFCQKLITSCEVPQDIRNVAENRKTRRRMCFTKIACDGVRDKALFIHLL